MFDGKYILLNHTVVLQVHCAYTAAVQGYYAHWLGVVKQHGIPKKQSFYEDPLEIIEYDENIKHIESLNTHTYIYIYIHTYIYIYIHTYQNFQITKIEQQKLRWTTLRLCAS